MIKSSPQEAYNMLSGAQTRDWIKSFEKLRTSNGVRFKIMVMPTRYDAYHYPDHPGDEIILTSKEVFAFIEGCHCAAKENPVYRPGTNPGYGKGRPW